MNEQRKLLEVILDEISDTLNVIHQHAGKPLKGEISPELEKQVNLLEAQVQLFQEINEKAIQASNVPEEESDTQLKPRQKKIVDRAKRMKKEVDQMHNNLEKAIQKARTGEVIEEKKGERKGERKKKFKRVGGDKGWIPL